jgi:uncharacterized protein YgiM (DUF1202 family)
MRCPECNQRNSVAAKKCAACDVPLRRKPIPLSFKVFIGTLVGIVFVFWLAALSSAINNPEKTLTSTASTLTGKSNSAEQMMGNIKHFDKAMNQFLQKYGSLSSSELSSKLSTDLPKSLYESHIFEILPNLKLVEIDTALNATNYLLLLNNGQTQVLPIIGLDVYDSNSFLPQNNKSENDKKAKEGQLLVLLGHTANIHGHQPRVKVLLLSSTLQSDNIVDLTDTVVPRLYGEGSAKFSPNQKDIELSISLFSRGQELNVFSAEQLKSTLPVENESLYEQLIWQNDSYSLRSQPGTSKLYALYAAAHSLKNHIKLGRFRTYFSASARHTIEQTPPVKSEQGFVISTYKPTKKSGNSNNVYVLKNDTTKAIVELRTLSTGKKAASSWYVNSLSVAKIIPAAPTSVTVITPPQTKSEPEPSPQEAARLPLKEIEKPEANLKESTRSQSIKIEKPDLIETNKTPVVVPQPQQTTSSTTTATEAHFIRGLKATVKLRSGPGIEHQSIYEVAPNERLSIIGKENGWYHVKVADKEGFVYAGLVNNHKNGYRNTTIKQNCTVKDDQQHLITSLERGERLIILSGPRNNRYKIMLSDGKIGYVNRESIDSTVPESPPPSVP